MDAPGQARREKRPARPLGPETLRELALHYVGRYATSSGRLSDYLRRKLRERGWDGSTPADIPALVERFVTAGYLDDASYAAARKASLLRRGYGPQRIRQTLRFSGVGDEIATAEGHVDVESARQAALDFARRKRLGPYSREPADQRQRDRAIAAMLRAGHDYTMVREIMAAPSED